MNHFKDTVGNFAEEYELDQSPVKIWGVATSRTTRFFCSFNHSRKLHLWEKQLNDGSLWVVVLLWVVPANKYTMNIWTIYSWWYHISTSQSMGMLQPQGQGCIIFQIFQKPPLMRQHWSFWVFQPSNFFWSHSFKQKAKPGVIGFSFLDHFSLCNSSSRIESRPLPRSKRIDRSNSHPKRIGMGKSLPQGHNLDILRASAVPNSLRKTSFFWAQKISEVLSLTQACEFLVWLIGTLPADSQGCVSSIQNLGRDKKWGKSSSIHPNFCVPC